MQQNAQQQKNDRYQAICITELEKEKEKKLQ